MQYVQYVPSPRQQYHPNPVQGPWEGQRRQDRVGVQRQQHLLHLLLLQTVLQAAWLACDPLPPAAACAAGLLLQLQIQLQANLLLGH
jgi:hypothetical protein